MRRLENENMHNHNNSGQEEFTTHRKICTVETGENIDIITPIAIRAYADSCNVEIECRGYEIINEPCKIHNTKKFKIKQKIYISIPINFVAECSVGEGKINFDEN